MHSFDPEHHNDAAHGELLTLLALGEPIEPQQDAHIQDCVDCQNELAALRRTVTRARYLGIDEDQSLLAPSPAVWQNIVAEIGLDSQGTADELAPRRRDHRSWRYWAGAAVAAVLIAVAAAGGGYLTGRKVEAGPTTITASAALAQMPGGPTGVQGVATLHKTATGPRVS
ncbi:MAG: hypothetical protein ABI137_10350, partial [Antricoccus sp.]